MLPTIPGAALAVLGLASALVLSAPEAVPAAGSGPGSELGPGPAPNAAAPGARDWPPTLSPAEGARVRRVLTRTAAMASTSVERFQNDETMELEVELEIEQRESATLVDVFSGLADDRVIELRRTFEELSFEAVESAAEQTTEASPESPLVGETVVFAWDDDEDEWTASFAEDSDVDEDVLDDLEVDVDLTILLPDDDVEPGDSWDCDAAAVRRLMFPAGDLAFDWDDDSDLRAATDEASEDFWDQAEGGIEVTFAGREELDGEDLATFALAIELEGSGRSTEELDGVDGERYVQLDRSLEAEGTLVWNVGRGHLHALEFAGEQSATRTTAVNLISPEGEEFHAGQRVALEGTLEQTQTVEPLDEGDEDDD